MGILRLYFAFAVLFGHISSDVLIEPIYAVKGFYVISGFYMSFILNEKYTTPATNITFYKKRFMRLLPTYWIGGGYSLIVALLFYQRGMSSIMFFDFNHFPPNASLSTYLYIIISNIIVFGQDIALFLGISPESGDLFFSTLSYAEEYPLCRYMLIPVAWSIGLEFLFYLIAPFTLRNRKRIVFLLFFLSLLSNFITNYYGLNNSNWRYRFFPSELSFFLAGYFSYLIYKRIEKQQLSTAYRWYVLVGMILLLTLVMKLNSSFFINASFLMVACLTTIPYLFYAYKHDKNDRLIGELSYPLYLIHPLFIGIGLLCGIDSPLFVVFGSLISSYLCYRYFIAKIEKIRKKL